MNDGNSTCRMGAGGGVLVRLQPGIIGTKDTLARGGGLREPKLQFIGDILLAGR
jgi:hypothetical protein